MVEVRLPLGAPCMIREGDLNVQNSFGLFAPFLVTALVAAPALARADDFYKGKTVTIIVGFSAGGGYDLYARALARFIPDHIPGHPTVIVQNMPGAGSLVAVRSVNVHAAERRHRDWSRSSQD